MIHKKLLSLLVLLMTAASGAWADEQSETFTTFDSSGSQLTFTGEHFTIEGVAIDIDGLYIDGGFSQTVTISARNGENITKIEAVVSYLQSWGSSTLVSTSGTVSGTYTVGQTITISNINATTVTLSSSSSDNRLLEVKNWTVYYGDAPDVVVTTNAAEAGAAFTEATFTMPAFDATAEFDLVRDMNDATYPVAFSGLPEPAADTGVAKIVVKKNSTTQKFEFLNAITIALIDPLAATDAQNIIEADGITIKVLKGTENISGAIDYDQDNPITLAAFLADTQPGYYWIKAVPTDETTSPYIGTVYSSELLLIKGYEVTVPAGEYITYYRDEKLTLEAGETNAQLYTISSVSGTTATATELTVSTANKPILVKNLSTTEEKTFLLIPTDDAATNVTYYSGFVGTTEATTIAASTTTQTNYAFNGKQFVYVKNALSVAANKAWLSVTTGGSLHARSLTLTFGDSDATGIRSMDNGQLIMDNWYDLNGRKLNAAPTRKGIYIQNGQKVVVK